MIVILSEVRRAHGRAGLRSGSAVVLGLDGTRISHYGVTGSMRWSWV